MAPNISWPSDTVTVIDNIRDTIGRDITIDVETQGVPCPASGCGLDPVTQLSVNQFCITCSGYYWINTLSGYVTKAHITWGDADRSLWETGGTILDGDCLVQIKYTVASESAVANAGRFHVDNKILVKKSVDYRGVPAINRMLITLEQED
jgi:hypothetical protein